MRIEHTNAGIISGSTLRPPATGSALAGTCWPGDLAVTLVMRAHDAPLVATCDRPQ